MDSEKKFYISTIKKIGKSIYKCLVKLCHKNRKNQVYCLNFVKLFIEHIGLGLGASKIILNICKNIRIQVSNSLDLIEMYAAMIEKERSKQVEYLSFFSSVCVSKGEANTINQEKIFNLLFKNKELSKNVLIRTETIGKCLYLILNNNKVSVESCFKNKVLIDFAEEIETFVQFIGLYSNLSYGRHHECTSLFVSEYSFHVLDQII
jgi:RIH domain.